MHIITNSFKVGNETRNGIKENSLERGRLQKTWPEKRMQGNTNTSRQEIMFPE